MHGFSGYCSRLQYKAAIIFLDYKEVTMKKALMIIAIMILVPVLMFAELAVGGVAMLKSPVLLGQKVNLDHVNINQFTFGGDIRFKVEMIQLESMLVCSTGDITGLDIYTDAGLAFDIALIRLSVGAGPNFTWNFTNKPPLQAGLNAKVGADLMLGNVSVGCSYLMVMNYNSHVDIYTNTGLFGIQVLVWM